VTHSEMSKIILKVRDKVFQIFRKGGKTKKELHKFTREELGKSSICFPRVSENYKKMVERLAREKSSQIIPNGKGPYEDLFEFFDLEIS